MPYENILVQTRGSACWVTFNRPASMNALTPAVIADLTKVTQEVEANNQIRALVLTGTGKGFCSGSDLKESLALKELRGPMASVEEFLVPLQSLHKSLRDLPKPVIAAVNGYCMAGGLETILVCDLVIAAESAVFSDAHAKYGLLPALGGAQGLARSVGPFKAKEMLFTAGHYTAQQMYDLGIVCEVTRDDQLQERTEAMVELLTERSAEGLARMKKMVNDELDMPWAQASDYELAMYTNHMFSSVNTMEGLRAFTLKRKPSFS